MALTDGPIAQVKAAGLAFSTTITVPITVPLGNDRLLAVGVSITNPTSQTISGVTYAGTALSNNDQDGTPSAMNVANGTDCHTYIWRLIAPVTGTNNIVITLSAAGVRYAVIATVWDGVDQTTALGVVATATGSSTGVTATPTVDAASASGEIVLDMVGDRMTSHFTTDTVTVGAGQTEIEQDSGNHVFAVGASYEAGDTTVTMSWTVDAGGSVDHDWATVAIALKPSSDTSDPVASNTSLAELSVMSWRKAPELGFQSSAAILARENMMLNYEAAGVLPRVVEIQRLGDRVVWNDVWTIPSVAKAGGMALTDHPTPMTPNGDSLFVSTQDTLMQYPYPFSFEPHLTAFPRLARSYDDNANLTPTFYPSAVDFGDMAELRFLEVYAQNMTRGTDGIKVGFSWDDTMQWFEGEALSENYCMWEFTENFGRVLRIGVSVNDADDSEPVGPTITKVIGWWRFRPDRKHDPPTVRVSPEQA
jgi:hypothetical protein